MPPFFRPRNRDLAWALALIGCAAVPTGALATVNAPVLEWSANAATAVGGCKTTADAPGYYCDTGWYASPAVADLDGDGHPEVIWGGYDLVVLDGATGVELARAQSDSRIWPGVAVADLTGDGNKEIVVGRSSNQLTVYRANVAGPSWSLGIDFAANPFTNNCSGNSCEVRTLAVEDLESDGQLEIVVGRASGGDTEQLNVYEPNGSVRPGWPARRTGEAGYGWGMYNENVTIADLDGDGRKEIFGPTDTHYVTALDPDGNQLPTNGMFDVFNPVGPKVWSQVGIHVLQSMDLQGYANCGDVPPAPLAERLRPNFANSAPAVADLDGDGSLEMVVVGNVYDCDAGNPDGDLYEMPWIFNKDRTRWSSSASDWTDIPSPGPGSAPLSEDYNVIQNNVPNAVLADLDGDGKKEILFPSYDGKLHAYWLDKTEHGSWPFAVPGSGIRFASEPVVVDLDNDGQAEVIFTSWPENVAGRVGQLHVLNSMGQQLYAVDLPQPGAYVQVPWNGGLAAPTLANIDADADLEVVVGTVNSGVVAYKLPGSANARILWGTGRGGLKRTGALGITSALSVSDVSIAEGNTGSTNASFTISLTPASTGPVSVSYATADGTAVAGLDYTAESGSLSFAAGETSKSVAVPVLGDQLDEDDETFSLNLQSPVGASIVDGQGIGTILDDDDPVSILIGGASGPEGTCAPMTLTFPVTLNGPSGKTVSVSYATSGLTATPDVDYVTSTGTISFAPGTTAQSVSVPIIPDFVPEPDEAFEVNLSDPVNGQIVGGTVQGTILDDDSTASAAVELTHGAELRADLAALPGGVADQDLYAVSQKPHASYELVASGFSGNLAPLVLQRQACGGGVVQNGTPIDGGKSLALRFENATALTVNTDRIVVSGACGAGCDASDSYRVGVRETTLGISRFNNSGTQVTVLALQNRSAASVSGHVWFWGPSGALVGSQPFSLAARGTFALNTSALVPASTGSVTISHDGPYGALSGKAVAVEPASGFTFDTPAQARPR